MYDVLSTRALSQLGHGRILKEYTMGKIVSRDDVLVIIERMFQEMKAMFQEMNKKNGER